MEIQDMQDHIESQNATIEAQARAIEELKSKVASSAKQAEAPVPEGMTKEQVEALQAKAGQVEELQAKLAEMTNKEQQRELQKLYPAIKDWSVVHGGTFEERKAHAEAINKMIDGKPAAVPAVEAAAEKTYGQPGEEFGKVPPAGEPNVDKLTAEQLEAVNKDLTDAQKKGNLQGVLDAVFKRNPRATKSLFSG